MADPLNEITTQLGIAIQERRAKLGMSLRDLADETGVSIAHLSTVERGISRISVDRFCDVAAAMKTTASGMLRGIHK